jgi:hypothetical protein
MDKVQKPSNSEQLIILVSVSPDLNPSDFHLRVLLKDKVRANSSEELEKNQA